MRVIRNSPGADAAEVYDAREVLADEFVEGSNPANTQPPPPPIRVRKGQIVVTRRESGYLMVMNGKQFREKFRSIKEDAPSRETRPAATTGGKPSKE